MLYIYAIPELRVQTQRAIEAWNRATPGTPVAYLVNTEEEANVRIKAGDLRSALGGISREFGTDSGVITIDSDYLGPRSIPRTNVALLTHEIGHQLGLGHTPTWEDSTSPFGYREGRWGVMSVGTPEQPHGTAFIPSVHELGQIRHRFGYQVSGYSTEHALRAYVRHLNRSTAYRARLHAQKKPRVNTPSETRLTDVSNAPKPTPKPKKPTSPGAAQLAAHER